MSYCGYIPACPFYNGRIAHEQPAAAETMMRRFCQGDSAGCARHKVLEALGGPERVPADLVPSDIQRAREVIREERQRAAAAR